MTPDVHRLTALPDRQFFVERLEHVLVDARRLRFHIAVLAVDLDRFREVNSILGHRTGDTVLEVVGSRLLQSLRHDDTVARSAGDEFLVLLSGMAWPNDVEIVARKLRSAIAQRLEIDGSVVNLNATIGAGVFPGDGVDGESLLQHAATALYRAKCDGQPFERSGAAGALARGTIGHPVIRPASAASSAR
jgi:diguanylate cyclase (GGDEF)-like protein